MDSESAASASAQQKHHKHMLFGKKQRYIEVFQCSGEDMNMVLNGGGFQYQSPPAISSKTIASSGMLPSRPAPQAQPLQISIPPPLTHLSIPSNVSASAAAVHQTATNTNQAVATVTSGNPNSTSSLIAQQQQAHFIAQQSLLARQQQAAAVQAQHVHQMQAAQQQSAADQMALFQNFGFIPSAGAAAQNQAGMSANPYQQYQLAPQMPLYFLPPRPMGLPMGLSLPANVLGQMQYSGMQSAGYPGMSMQGGQMNQSVQSASNMSSNAKRSYDNAFRNNESMTAPPAKRVYNPNQAPGNIYGTYPYPQI
jgi:epithelial splicing regulatory protein 1/2